MSIEKNIYVDIWLISSLTSRAVSQILEDVPLSPDEFAIYGLISDLAPITSADLVRATGLSPTTVSGMVRRCEERGELVRRDNPDDSRSALLELTPEAYRLLGLVVPRLLEAIDEIDVLLGGRHRQVRTSLEHLDTALRRAIGVGARPYHLGSTVSDVPVVAYQGEPLSMSQEDEVRQFIDWLRARDNG